CRPTSSATGKVSDGARNFTGVARNDTPSSAPIQTRETIANTATAASLRSRLATRVLPTAAIHCLRLCVLPSRSALGKPRRRSLRCRRPRRRSPLALARAGVMTEQRLELPFRAEQILERVAIEHGEERAERIAEHAAQHASGRDHASRGLRAVEARHDMKAALDLAHDIAEPNLRRRNTEPQPAAFAAQRLEIARAREVLYDFHQMIT